MVGLPKMLGNAGYTTLLVGRYMHQKPADESYGYQKEIRGSTHIDDDEYDKFLKQAAPDTGGICDRSHESCRLFPYTFHERKDWLTCLRHRISRR